LYDGNEKFTKEEAKNHKEVQRGVKQTLEKYLGFPASYYAWKRKWKQWAKRFSHGMMQTNLNGFELEKENAAKSCYQKELEGKLKTNC
jgi:hypothetical protein